MKKRQHDMITMSMLTTIKVLSCSVYNFKDANILNIVTPTSRIRITFNYLLVIGFVLQGKIWKIIDQIKKDFYN